MKFTDRITIQNFLLAHEFINTNLPTPVLKLFHKSQADDNPQPSVTRVVSANPTTTLLRLPKARTHFGLSSVIYRSCATWNYINHLYFPKNDTDQTYKPPCSLSKHSCKGKLKKHLSEKYISENIE